MADSLSTEVWRLKGAERKQSRRQLGWGPPGSLLRCLFQSVGMVGAPIPHVTRTPQSGHTLNSRGEDSAALRGQGPLTDGQRQLSQGGDLSGEGGGEVNRTMSDLPTPSLHHQAFY